MLKVASCVFVSLFVSPLEAPGSLSLCSLYVKGCFMCLFICKTCGHARQPVFVFVMIKSVNVKRKNVKAGHVNIFVNKFFEACRVPGGKLLLPPDVVLLLLVKRRVNYC